MSNGYLVAAEADLDAAREIADGFGLDVLNIRTAGDQATVAAALANAPNVGLLLSDAATRDAAYYSLVQFLAQKLSRAQLILVGPDALSHFGFIPEGWPAMSLEEARLRSSELVRRRDAPPEPPVHAAPLEPPPAQEDAQALDDERERAITIEPPADEAEAAPEAAAPASDHGTGEFYASAPEEPAASDAEPEAPPPAKAAPSDNDALAAPANEAAHETPPAPAAAAPRSESAPWAPHAPQAAPAPSGEASMTRAGVATPESERLRDALRGAEAPADATAFAPKKLRRGSPELVRVVIHQPKDLKEVIKTARKIDPSTHAAPQGMKIGDIEFGNDIGVALEVRGAACDGAIQRRKWQGAPLDFNFSVDAEDGVKQAVLIARVFVKDAQIGTIAFTRPISGPKKKPADAGDARMKRHKRVFLSYSSHDRDTVSAIATAYEAAGIPHFWDRASLKSGEEWSPRLRKEIDRADLFHLCWSRSAATSEWVEKEAEHALTRRKRSNGKQPDITVQMLDGPPWAPHPAALDSINFDDFVRAAVVGYARGDGGAA